MVDRCDCRCRGLTRVVMRLWYYVISNRERNDNPMKAKRITLKEVAQKAGVSVPAVVQAMNGTGRLKEATRRHIIRTAQQLGYRPHAAAHAMRTGRYNAVALIHSRFRVRSLYSPALQQGILRACCENGLTLVVGQCSDDELLAEDHDLPEFLRKWVADGLLLNYNAQIPEKLIERVAHWRLPAVWINSKHATDCVYPDDFGAAAMATEQLLAKGYRHIAFVCYVHGSREVPLHYSGKDRFAGYADTMTKAGLTPRHIQPQLGMRGRAAGVFSAEWLRREDRPEAVITYSAMEARCIVHAAMEAGISPNSFPVIAFHHAVVDDAGYELPTLIVPNEAMGERAVQLLQKKLAEGPDCSLPPTPIPYNGIANSHLIGAKQA
ncbi:MAG: LacI family transcriptional regulator [Lentisphaerae bacterium]|nr:MAG: LacI family transcriptional regulator [Lentisphaerota bacterium]